MDLTGAPSSSWLLRWDAGRRNGGSCSIRTNEEPAATRREEDDNNDKIIIRSCSRQRRRKDLTTTAAATLVTMKRQTRKITEAAGVNDDDEPEIRQQQVQVFACRKFSRRTAAAAAAEGGGKRQPPRKSTSTIGRRASSLAMLGRHGGRGFNVFAAPAAILALVMVLLSAASQTTEAIKLSPDGDVTYQWTGEQFSVICRNDDNIKNAKFTWLGPNRRAITEDRSQRVHAEKNGSQSHRLVLLNATAPQDEGNYTCNLGSTDDKTPRQSSTFDLRLHKSTSFLDTQNHVVLYAGAQGEISCHVEFDQAVDSNPTMVSWHRDGKPIEQFNDPAYSASEYDSQTRLSKLTISPVSRRHEGQYTCRAEAITPALSKISDFSIKLETHYAPFFDKPTESVWVAKRLGVRSSANQNQPQETNVYGNQAVRQQQPIRTASRGGQKRPNSGYSNPPHQLMPLDSDGQQQQQRQSNSSEPLRIRVELNCTCQANPPANIVWSSTSSSNLLLSKGYPPHVVNLSEPNNLSSSILVIDYVLSPDWQYKNDQYTCSAKNKIGDASKVFTIEQGNPPPAFQLANSKPQYYPQDSMLHLTIAGPSSELPEAAQSSDSYDAQRQLEGTPDVDSFRIRAETPSAVPPAAGVHQKHHPASSGSGHHQAQQHWHSGGSNFPQAGPFAEWTLQPEDQQMINGNLRRFTNKPVAFNVSLRNLPPGNQRLFLEAHNAVGWSPYSTPLGDFNIVSGATASFYSGSGAALHFHVIANLLVSFCIILGLAKVY